MALTLLANDAHPAAAHVGFALGIDHARHGVLPTPEQMQARNPVYRGWRNGQSRFGERAPTASRYTRQWLQLRLDAWQRAVAFEAMTVTPNHLRQIDVTRCPVTREPLAHGDALVSRLSEEAGFAAGNLAVLSPQARRAMAGRDWQDAMKMAAQAASADDGLADGLDAAAWQRLAVLMSFVCRLPHAQAATLPLCVRPPNRVRLLNPAQGVQAMITHRLGEPGWCQGMRVLADQLPGAELRQAFNLLVSALLPRAIGVACDHDGSAMRRAREDAWCDERVNRCWQRFVLALGLQQTQTLLAHGVGSGLAGVHALLHDDEAAVDGWALRAPGRRAASADVAAEPRAVPRAAWHDGEPPARWAGARPAPRLLARRAAVITAQAKTATT